MVTFGRVQAGYVMECSTFVQDLGFVWLFPPGVSLPVPLSPVSSNLEMMPSWSQLFPQEHAAARCCIFGDMVAGGLFCRPSPSLLSSLVLRSIVEPTVVLHSGMWGILGRSVEPERAGIGSGHGARLSRRPEALGTETGWVWLRGMWRPRWHHSP